MNKAFIGFFVIALLFSFTISETVVPFLLWSPQNVFGGQKQHLSTISKIDVETLLESSCGIKSSLPSNLQSYIEQLKEHNSEVAVFFVYSQERFHTHSIDDLTNLQSALEGASSSLAFPYANLGSNSVIETLEQLSFDLYTNSPRSSVVLTGHTDSLSSLEDLPNLEIKTPQELLHSDIFNNGVPDLLIVGLGDQANELIGQIQQLIHQRIQGNYVAAFTVQTSSQSKRILRDRYAQDFGYYSPDDSSSTQGEYTSFFPIQVFQVIIVSVLLLVITLIGACCTFSIQTPIRYETPKQRRNDM
jgi:hypothetical protein